jgi:hypothetical protein
MTDSEPTLPKIDVPLDGSALKPAALTHRRGD